MYYINVNISIYCRLTLVCTCMRQRTQKSSLWEPSLSLWALGIPIQGVGSKNFSLLDVDLRDRCPPKTFAKSCQTAGRPPGLAQVPTCLLILPDKVSKKRNPIQTRLSSLLVQDKSMKQHETSWNAFQLCPACLFNRLVVRGALIHEALNMNILSNLKCQDLKTWSTWSLIVFRRCK